jgi:hypothetical protein
MTDRAVQPEAPTTEAGRALLDQWNPGHVNPRLVQTVLAIEAEAYRQGWDVNTATSFGNRAASQERPSIDVTALHYAMCESPWIAPFVHDAEYPGEWPCSDVAARLAGGSVASPEPRP